MDTVGIKMVVFSSSVYAFAFLYPGYSSVTKTYGRNS